MSTELPTYRDLILPCISAVSTLGGSATSQEIVDQVVQDMGFDDELLSMTYENRPTQSIVLDRIAWARSYSKLGGALESPRRGLYVLAPLGRELLNLSSDEAQRRCHEMDREVRTARRKSQDATSDDESTKTPHESTEEDDTEWKDAVLQRLHALSPSAFEEFVVYLLRAYGLELRRTGQSGDQGIDGIGLAPITPVLSVRVAVQAKRFDPTSAVGRDAVALFQRDASAAGAERAVFVTLGRFTQPARDAATLATPNVDLIDGARICDLMLTEGVGIVVRPEIDERFMSNFAAI
jgi:restriction system protein